MAFAEETKNAGLYVQSTAVWDVARLQEVDVQSPEFKELLVRLYQNVNSIVIALNLKDSAYYVNQEFVTGQLFFNSVDQTQLGLRAVFRKVINIGALGAGVTTIAHGLAITNTWKFTRIYGVASDTVGFNYYPLPWASAAGATNIELKVNLNNVVITNNSGINFTDCYTVLEFVKS